MIPAGTVHPTTGRTAPLSNHICRICSGRFPCPDGMYHDKGETLQDTCPKCAKPEPKAAQAPPKAPHVAPERRSGMVPGTFLDYRAADRRVVSKLERLARKRARG